MQLDQAKLVMRPRSMSEVGDLTLAMLRTHPRSIIIGFLTGAAIWVAMDLALLAWIPIGEARLGIADEEATYELYRYLTWMAVLVTLQTPVAGSLVTLWLGREIFEERLRCSEVIRELWKLRSAIFWVLMMRSLVLPVMLLLLIRWGSPASFFWDYLFPVLVLFVLFFTRGMNPFVPEIILLEKCPVRGNASREGGNLGITLRTRSNHLHRKSSGENGGRFFIQGVVYFVLSIALVMTLMSFRGVLFLRWDFLNLPVLLMIFPAGLWMVSAISVVARLLFYLDTRLRLEGWDVELLIRAEVIRQFQSSLPQVDRREQAVKETKKRRGQDELMHL
ncbi:MAG: hypothetical protein ACON4H_05915 [Rubripirellula sp.]